MILKKRPHAALPCGIALAILGFSVHAAEPEVPALATEPAAVAAGTPASPVEATAAAPAPQQPTTRVRFGRGFYKPGIERLRVVRREDTGNYIAGQIALNVATTLIAGRLSVGAQGFSKDDLGGTTPEELKDDPLAVNPAMSELNDALSKVATDIYRKRAEAAYATALTDGSTPEEIEEARQVQKEADTPLLPGPWHLVYENLTGTDELFRLKFGAELGRAGFMRPPFACLYQSEPIAWTQWKADNWQLLREERAKAVASCTETLAATPEKRW
ncbi:hypothetical protein [Variovorax sp. EL159]|uniref:hypothetical protein n=1 Tax=Variovorax sp. EL159 TaxID=1566270 RepID=UPI000884B391|nr:hypothetical protein [Variovorax sp. EL159]SCX74376.1 hypothetical protein SAMN03159363_6120 [Variovorax sp. EL159]